MRFVHLKLEISNYFGFIKQLQQLSIIIIIISKSIITILRSQ